MMGGSSSVVASTFITRATYCAQESCLWCDLVGDLLWDPVSRDGLRVRSFKWRSFFVAESDSVN